MDIKEIAADAVAIAKAGKTDDIGEKYWAENVVSYEPMEGPMQRAEGIEALRGKAAWWYGAHEIHSVETLGPWVNGDQFGIRWIMDVTQKESGQRFTMDEFALFTVKDGRIIEERYFY